MVYAVHVTGDQTNRLQENSYGKEVHPVVI